MHGIQNWFAFSFDSFSFFLLLLVRFKSCKPLERVYVCMCVYVLFSFFFQLDFSSKRKKNWKSKYSMCIKYIKCDAEFSFFWTKIKENRNTLTKKEYMIQTVSIAYIDHAHIVCQTEKKIHNREHKKNYETRRETRTEYQFESKEKAARHQVVIWAHTRKKNDANLYLYIYTHTWRWLTREK